MRAVDWGRVDIEEIDLSHCYGLDDAGLTKIVSKLRHIRYLRTAVTDSVMGSMLWNASRLEVFEIHRRSPVRSALLSALLTSCTNMVALDTSNIPIDAKYFRLFIPKMTKLQVIVIAAHEVLGTFDVLQKLMIHCSELEYVGVNCYHSNEDQFMRQGLLGLASHCKKLKVIGLEGFLVDSLIEKLKSITAGNEDLFNNVIFQSPIELDFPSMKNGLENEFKRYTSENEDS